MTKATSKPSGWATLRTITKPYRAPMAGLAAWSFIGALLEAGFLVLLTGVVLAMATARASIGPVLGQTVPIPVALAVGGLMVLARLGFSLIAVRMQAALAARVTTDQRRTLARAYLGASWGMQQSEPSGRLQELVTSFVGRVTTTMNSINQVLTAALSLLAFVGTGLVVDPVATLAMLVALAVLGLVLAPVRRRIRSEATALVASNLAFVNTIAELGSLGQEMHTLGVGNRFLDRIDRTTDANTANIRRVQVLNGILAPLYTFLAYAAVLGGVAALSLVEVRSLAAVGSAMLLLLRSLSYGQQLVAVAGTVSASVPFLNGLLAAVALYSANSSSGGDRRPGHPTPLALAEVGFRYSNDRPYALRDVTATIDRGEMVGVIGPSGAGKSTLAQLLLGLRDPSAGLILPDGVDLLEVDRTWWTRRVAFVPQEAQLFTGTVAENIRFFREGLSDDDLRDAAARANVLRDIEALPEGFNTHLGERGSQLSGGQRQRLSIARALVGGPELLILDEPTSALDGQSEALIRRTLSELHGRITIVIIAHRMSTLELCDRIMVIEDGAMSAWDTPERLRRNSAFYRKALAISGID